MNTDKHRYKPKTFSAFAAICVHLCPSAVKILPIVFLCSVAHAAPQSAATPEILIKQFPLDERIVYEIPISTGIPTTLMFPSAPTALEGAGISANPETPAPVFLSHTPGRHFLSVRALKPDARATLNVIWKNRTYIIRFTASDKPCGSVTFYEDRNVESLHSRATTNKRVTPAVLLELLDRAKSYRLVHAQQPDAVHAIEHSVPSPAANTTRYEDFSVIVEEVFRFDAVDTLVLKLRLESASDSEILYDTQKLAVRIGSHVYPASIADASGVIPPRATVTAFFAITGRPDGSRANLSVKNIFNIIVPRVTATESPVTSP